MANLYFVGHTSDNWSYTDNWATTSGGTTHPTTLATTDFFYLDANSPNCILDASRTVGGVICTGYTNTLSLSIYTLTINASATANLTLSSEMTFDAGTSTILFTSETGAGAHVILVTADKSFYNINFIS